MDSAFAFLGLWNLGPFPHRTALLALGWGVFFWPEVRAFLLQGMGGGGCWLFVSSLSVHSSSRALLEDPTFPIGGLSLPEGGPLSTRWKPQAQGLSLAVWLEAGCASMFLWTSTQTTGSPFPKVPFSSGMGALWEDC